MPSGSVNISEKIEVNKNLQAVTEKPLGILFFKGDNMWKFLICILLLVIGITLNNKLLIFFSAVALLAFLIRKGK